MAPDGASEPGPRPASRREQAGSGAELTLWAGSVRPFSLLDRAAAARAGGFTATSLFPFDVAAAHAAGLSTIDVRELFEHREVRIAVLDPLTTWLPGSRVPDDLPPDDPAAGAIGPDEMFDLATALGAELVTVLALFDDPVEPAAGSRAFAALCDRAAERDL